MILKSELNAANRIEAINTLAIPVVTYSFNIIKWKISKIKKLDTRHESSSPLHECTIPKLIQTGSIFPGMLGGGDFPSWKQHTKQL